MSCGTTPALIKATLQDDSVDARVPPQHVPKRLVCYDCAGEERSPGGLIVELPKDIVDQTRQLGEQDGSFATAGRTKVEARAGEGPGVVMSALTIEGFLTARATQHGASTVAECCAPHGR